jgi:hypothetical protein
LAYQEFSLYVDSVSYGLVAQWQATHAYSVGNIIRQLAAPAVNNERCFVCILAGTSLSSEPSWGTPAKGTIYTESGGPKWQECTALPALNSDGAGTNAWQSSAGSAVQGAIIKDVAAAHYFICTLSGTGGTGAEPSWNTTAGGTTADGSVTWTCLGAISSFTTRWAAPGARLSLLNSAGWLANSGMTVYVGDDHAETSSANIFITPLVSCSIVCVDHTVSLPAGASNIKTTATITASSGGGLTYSVFSVSAGINIYAYGIQFIHSAAGGTLSIANVNGTRIKCEQCVFSYTSSGTSPFQLGYQNPAGGYLELTGCTFHFSQAAQYLALNGSQMLVKNCTMTGTSPTTGIKGNSGLGGGAAVFEGCDFSNWASNLLGGPDLAASTVFKDCKLNSGVTIVLTGDSTLSMSGCIDITRCDSGGTNYRNERHHWSAAETTSTNVVRTGGASDGATPISHRITTTTNLTAANIIAAAFFPAIPMVIWNAVTGSNRNVTLYGIANDSRVPNNDEVWFDVEYLGSASSPQGSFASGTKSNILATGTALTANTSAWDSAATARANTTAYVVGNVIKTASNPGRIFFCTSAGTSAGSEPGGYATAVDGGSVTDSGATFRAGCRFSQTLTLPQAGVTTWNPSDLLNVTLSNGNLTATAPSAAGGVRAAAGASSGKYYWECTCNATQANEGVGMGTATASLTSGVSTVAFLITSGQIYVNGSNVASGSGFSTGNVICVAVDLTNSLIWFRVGAAGNWNNSSSNNPATGVGGVSISVLTKPLFPQVDMSGGNGASYTANFGASTFAGAVPAGFSPWNSAAAPLAPAIAQPGYLYAYPRIGRPSMTYYLDPLPVLS